MLLSPYTAGEIGTRSEVPKGHGKSECSQEEDEGKEEDIRHRVGDVEHVARLPRQVTTPRQTRLLRYTVRSHEQPVLECYAAFRVFISPV